MSTARTFYSWQADLPNSTNRGFIEDALEKAAKVLASDREVTVEPVIDRDTQGVAGSPDIATTIFRKIDQADAVVCDVSIIGHAGSQERPTPNPNVLVELGYAVGKLGWDRVVLVVNKRVGAVERLPFDLRQRRAIVYEAAEGKADRSDAKAMLVGNLVARLKEILGQVTPPTPPDDTIAMLQRIPPDSKICLQIFTRTEAGLRVWARQETYIDSTIVRLDVPGNSASFNVMLLDRSSIQTITVPLNAVGRPWQVPDYWFVPVAGTLRFRRPAINAPLMIDYVTGREDAVPEPALDY